MRHTRSTSVLVFAAVLIASFTAAACDGASSSASNPLGPSSLSGAMPGGGMGSMMGPGMGMGMAVDSEFDYLAQMIPHHEEAIVAARLLQQGTARTEMREFAGAIIDTQSAEVAQMRRWLESWYPGRDARVEYRPMMRDLTGLRGDALDRAFLDDMIPHHMMAVMMSQQFLGRGLADHDAVVPFAGNIRDTQHREIQMMRLWLAQWFR